MATYIKKRSTLVKTVVNFTWKMVKKYIITTITTSLYWKKYLEFASETGVRKVQLVSYCGEVGEG